MISASLAVEGPPRGLGGLPPPAGHHHHHAPNLSLHHHQQQQMHQALAAAAVASHHPGFVTYQVPSSSSGVDSWGGRPTESASSSTGLSSSVVNSTQQKGEFLRPKPPTSRYNGVPASTLNGIRVVANSHRTPGSKYSPPASSNGPVNLVQHKESPPSDTPSTPPTISAPSAPTQEDLTSIYQVASSAAAAHYSRLYAAAACAPPPPTFPYANLPGPYGALYPAHYTPLIRPRVEQTFLSPPPPPQISVYSPPSTPHSPQKSTPSPSSLRERRPSLGPSPPSSTATGPISFKVPSGKEGSLKHRILTRPSTSDNPLAVKKNLTPPVTPPSTPGSKVSLTNSSDSFPPTNFCKGSLIQLSNGELRRVEDMRTEDFVVSAQHCPELRLADSTMIRIQEKPDLGKATYTLSYNQNRIKTEFDASLDHPFFVYGQGWASLLPDRTFQIYGLKCIKLQVGDVCVSLTPRNEDVVPHTPPTSTVNNKGATITTTATTTAMTARQIVSPKTSNTTVSSAYQVAPVDRTMPPPPPTTSYHPIMQQHPLSPPHGYTLPSPQGLSSRHHQPLSPPHHPHQTYSHQNHHLLSQGTNPSSSQNYPMFAHQQHVTHPPRTHSAEEVAAIEASNARKRRWSAPDQIGEDEEQQHPIPLQKRKD